MRLAELALVVLVACGGSSDVTVVEVPPAPLPAPAPTQTAALPAPAQTVGRVPSDAECAGSPVRFVGGCRQVARVRMRELRMSSSSCYVDTLVHAGDEGQVLECPDGGVIAFGNVQFAGAASGRRYDLCSGSTFRWSDGCTWRSVQRIRGDLATGLVFHYAEGMMDGTGCASSSCTATAEIQVLP